MKPEGEKGGANPPPNKGKKVGKTVKRRTEKDKKERIWGKSPQKPYISSSLGDMARVMMRYACMENTYFYNNEPPPVEFYDFWQKFSVDPTRFPQDIVDTKRISIAGLKKNTSSFDFFGQYTAPIASRHDLDEGGGGGAAPRQKKRLTTDAQRLSDIWKDVRISMSNESFISSSTKISEDASVVPLETGWDEACSEDYQSSESDYGLDIHDRNRHHRHKQLNMAAGGDSQAHQLDDNKHSSLEFHTPQGLIDKQANAIAQSILAMQKRDNRILYELATKPRDLDIIDHFADDLDDSFLMDSYSYSELPDETFGPDFDFFNEDLIYKKKGKRGKKAAKDKHVSKSEDTDEAEEDDDDDHKDSSESECADDLDLECVMAKAKKKEAKKQKNLGGKQDDEDDTAPSGGGYAACLERRRKRIEDSLRAAVRKRSPMGSYKPPKGEEPLSKALASNSPGPAAYNPQLSGVKPNIHTALLSPRWNKNIHETLGPGPACFVPTPKCTCEMLTLHEEPRFKDDESLGPGPANVNLSNYAGTARDKPKAIIIGRKNRGKYVIGARFTNCRGLTRFGRDNPPKPIILSKREPRKKVEPGPGEYDPNDLYDTKVGIKMKFRIPPIDTHNTPGFYKLPDLIGMGDGFSFGIRDFMEMKDQSPGPVYQLCPPRPHPVSLTFRPFPMKGSEADPSPLEWGTKPGEGKIKVLPQAPRPFLHGSHESGLGKFRTPAPNHYTICDDCILCAEPGASFKKRYPQKVTESPGPAHYDPKPISKRAGCPVFQHKHKDKHKPEPAPLLPGADDLPRNKIIGGVMSPKWRERDDEEDAPELLNIFGINNRGPKKSIPISMKSRHSPFKYSHMAEPKQITFDTGGNGTCS